jgi:hypothetical protein
VDLGPQGRVVLQSRDDLLDRRDDGRVVLATERASEVGIRILRVVTREVHRDCTRRGDGLVAALALDIAGLEAVVARDGLDDGFDGDDLAGRVIAAPSVSCANSRSMRFFDSEAYAASRISAPSSSRTFDLIDDAMYMATSSGSATASTAAFLRRIAMRTSSSGGSMSASRPHANRVRSRSAMSRSRAACGQPSARSACGSRGRVERVEELVLRALLAGGLASSMRSTSMPRGSARNSCILPVRIA